mmetsp:Transcript_8347/g.23505  ORF Transcript_8347/g.23505 Transcript_8347/m.23505 type:complete len:243 (-) Transcript_8347:8-736(-)
MRLHRLQLLAVHRNRQDVELVVDDEARRTVTEGEHEALVETRLLVGVSFCPEVVVRIHGEVVELLQRRHALQEQNYDAAPLDRLHGAAEQVRRERLEVREDAHAEGFTEHLLRVFVVAVPDVGGRDEEVEGVVDVRVVQAPLDLLLDVLRALLPVAAEAELLLVAPEHRGLLRGYFRDHVVEVHNLVAAVVADDDEEAACLGVYAILHQGPDAAVHLLAHRARACGGVYAGPVARAARGEAP